MPNDNDHLAVLVDCSDYLDELARIIEHPAHAANLRGWARALDDVAVELGSGVFDAFRARLSARAAADDPAGVGNGSGPGDAELGAFLVYLAQQDGGELALAWLAALDTLNT